MFGIGPAELLVLTIGLGGFGLPLSMPPAPPDPVVQQAAPEQCLFYLEWSGTAKPDASSTNRTEQLLADKEVQQFVTELTEQIDRALAQAAKGKPDAEVLHQTLPGLLKTLVTRPTAIYLSEIIASERQGKVRGGLVTNVGDKAEEVARSLARLELLFAAELRGEQKIEDKTIGGVRWKRVAVNPDATAFLWGFRDNLFLVALGDEEAEALPARLGKKSGGPAWLTQLHADLPVDRPAVTWFTNLAGILKSFKPLIKDPNAPAVLDALGISQLKTLYGVSGLNRNGAVSKARLDIEGRPTGLLELLPAKPLTLDDLKIVPQDATMAWVLRFDAAEAYQQVLKLMTAIDPRQAQQFQANLAGGEQQLGLRLVDDLLKPLGDTWSLFSTSADGNNFWMGFALAVSVSDHDRLVKTHDQLLALAKGLLAMQGPNAPTIKESTFKGMRVFRLQPNGPVPVAPTWAITDKHLLVTVVPQSMKSLLERDANAGSLADIPSVQKLTASAAPLYVSYQDTASLLGQMYGTLQLAAPVINGALAQQGIEFDLPTLPSLAKITPYITPTVRVLRSTSAGFASEQYYSVPLSVDVASVSPVTVALLLPAIQAARETARRNMTSNNLKQQMLAMLNHEALHRTFPAAAISDKQGKRLLSWRVKLLPLLEEEALYKEFHLDEPWDSEHNRKLIQRMPAVYADPSNPQLAEAGKTRYLVPTGPAALFQGDKPPAINQITDGTSRTLAIVEVVPEKAVIWTKPEDIEVDPKNPLDGLEHSRGPGFEAAFCDGSVRMLMDTIDPETLRRLFDPRDGQAVDPSQF